MVVAAVRVALAGPAASCSDELTRVECALKSSPRLPTARILASPAEPSKLTAGCRMNPRLLVLKIPNQVRLVATGGLASRRALGIDTSVTPSQLPVIRLNT